MSRAQLTSTVEQNTGGAVSPVVAGKNAVINGGMDIWQRGTSIAGAASVSNYTADRWGGYRAGYTYSRQATGDTTNLPFIQYCMRAQRNSANTDTSGVNLFTSFESSNSIPFAGKTITFSFYARAGANYSPASSALTARFTTGTGTDQNILNGFTGATDTNTVVTLTTTWQRFATSISCSGSTTQIGLQFYNTPVGTAGTNDYFEVTGIQVEVGSVATPFSRAGGTLSGELAACQRYYETTDYLLVSSSNSYAVGYWKVAKRITPTITIGTYGFGSGGVVGATSYNPTSSFWLTTYNSGSGQCSLIGTAEL